MTRYHATFDGQIPFTAEEEAVWDAREAAAYSSKDTPDPAKIQEIRQERDRLLSETDWRGCSDVAMSNQWKAYRQALRDVPAQTEFPDAVTWPTKPLG